MQLLKSKGKVFSFPFFYFPFLKISFSIPK